MTLLAELTLLSEIAVPGHASFLIETRLNDLGQSPLSLAIALRLDDLAADMIAKLTPDNTQVILSSKDLAGWTVLDHAAVWGDAFYKQLKSLFGNKSYKHNYTLSPSFLRKICGTSRRSFSFRFHVYDKQGKLETLSEIELLKKFPFKNPLQGYSYFPKSTPECMYAMWEDMAQSNLDNDPTVENCEDDLNAYYHFVETTAKTGVVNEIALKIITHNDRGQPVNVGGGIVALQDIPAGKIFMEYAGDYIHTYQGNKSLYAFESVEDTFCVDAERICSPGAMMNHGWPNAKIVRIALPGRIALAVKALFPIKTGDEIRITYGIDCANFFNEAVDLAPLAVDTFLENHPFPQLLSAMSTDDPTFQDYQIRSGWTFLLRDNGVNCLKKFLEGKISVQDMKQIPKLLFAMALHKLHPLESGRWRLLLTPFVAQVPLTVLHQALYLMEKTPEKGPSLALQLKGHHLPADFQFT